MPVLKKMKWSKLLRLLKKTPRSLGLVSRKLLLLGIFILVVGAVVLFYLNSSTRGVEIDIVPPEKPVFLGKPFELEVSVSNNSQNTIENVQLILQLPSGISLLTDRNKVNVEMPLGEINSHGLVKEKFNLLALPSSDSNAYDLGAKVVYNTQPLSAPFSKTDSAKLAVSSIDFNFEVDVPETVFVGRAFPMKINYEYRTDESSVALEGPALELVIDSENDFGFLSAEPPTTQDNRWTLAGDGPHEISAEGRVNAGQQDVLVLKAKVVVAFSGEDYVLLEKEISTILAPSPLSFNISLGDPKSFVSPGELLTYVIYYRNNTALDLRDVLIRTQLLGEMFDINSLETDANFSELSKTITWSSGKFSRLGLVRKGEEGNFVFRIKVSPDFPVENLGDKDFVLTAKATIESPTVSQDSSTDRTAGASSLDVKVTGLLKINAQARFRDAGLGILNEGPFPPKVGASTEYTIHWLLKNVSTDVENVTVRAQLGNGVSFTGVTKGDISSLPELDETSREIVWKVGSLGASTGVLNEQPEAIFQIAAKPTPDLLGQFMPLISFTTVSAEDLFTGVSLSSTDEPLTTALPDDPSIMVGEGKVVN